MIKGRWDLAEVEISLRLMISKERYVLLSVVEGGVRTEITLDTPLCNEQSAKDLATAQLEEFKVSGLSCKVVKVEEIEMEQQGKGKKRARAYGGPHNGISSDVVAEAVRRLDAFPAFYRLLHITGERMERRKTI